MSKPLDQIKFWNECKKNKLALWQCPSFLFVVMGAVIIAVMIVTYFFSLRLISDPLIVSLIVIVITIILLIIGQGIIIGFEKMAEANRMKTIFVEIVSHQLRTPLTSIKWILNLFSMGQLGMLTAKQDEFLKVIEENNKKMLDMVTDLLDVNKIEEKGIKLQKEELDLKFLTEEAINDVQPIIKSRNGNIELIADKNSFPIKADKKKIQIVLHNLIDNAVKYNSRGVWPIVITIKQENGKISWSIKDNGMGISWSDKGRIFEKFFRAENAPSYKANGSGLGLFISKAFINAHKGKIGFKSKERAGSMFWFELPL